MSLGGFTLGNFRVMASDEAVTALENSLLVAGTSSIAALAIGTAMAFLCARSNVPARKLVYIAGIMPLFLPSYVGALAWVIIAGPSAGLFNVLMRDLGIEFPVDIYGIGGLAYTLAIYNAPYAFILVHGALSMMNPDLEDAAGIHGASLGRTFRHVTLPLALPAVLGAAMLVFGLAIENFAVAEVIGTPGNVITLPTLIFRLMNAFPVRGNEAAAVAIALTIVVIAVTLLQRTLISGKSFTTITGKGVKPRLISLGRWRWPAFSFAMMYFAAAVIVPMAALVLVSIQRSQFMPSFASLLRSNALSGQAFVEVLSSPLTRDAILNSVTVSLTSASLGVALSFCLAYAVYRSRIYARAGIEYVAMLPLAIPALVFGLGLLWTWLVMPIPIYGTLAVLIVAFVAHEIPQGYRGVSSVVMQAHVDLEDSAVMLGASRPRAVAHVTLPLMKVGLTSTFLLLLLLGMRELSVPLFLFTTDTRLLSIAIFDDLENGLLQRAAAVSIVYTVLIYTLSLVALRLGRVSFSDRQ